MPQIGWFEILIIVSIAIIIVGPKDFPIMLKKIGSWIGTAKKYISNVQNEVSSIDIDENDTDEKKENKSIDPLVILLKEQLKDKVKDVRISSRLTDSAVCLVGDDNAMDPHLEKILQQHNQLNQELSLKILEINSDHKLIKKMAKMCTKKEEIGEISKIATMLYEQSKILDGEKPSDPAGFSKDLIDIIYSSVN